MGGFYYRGNGTGRADSSYLFWRCYAPLYQQSGKQMYATRGSTDIPNNPSFLAGFEKILDSIWYFI
jgi:hypothetical protein